MEKIWRFPVFLIGFFVILIFYISYDLKSEIFVEHSRRNIDPIGNSFKLIKQISTKYGVHSWIF